MRKTIQSVLGSTHSIGSEQITLFIPSKDQLGQPIDQDTWTTLALETMGRLFRGATAFPPGRGVWRDDSRGGSLLLEPVVMVVSYVSKQDLTRGLPSLRTFLHRLGRETNQGEVGLVIGGDYYAISTYDLL